MKISIAFADDDAAARFARIIAEKAMEIEDDGNEGHPDAELLLSVIRQIRKAITQ